MVKLMRFKFLISSAIVILALIVSSGCDSINEALELKQRYEALHGKYEALLEQHDELKTKYKKAQKKIEYLCANKQRYIDNTNIMLQND